MGGNLTGLIELFVVLLFGVGWGVIELVALRLDRQKAERERAAAAAPREEVHAARKTD